MVVMILVVVVVMVVPPPRRRAAMMVVVIVVLDGQHRRICLMIDGRNKLGIRGRKQDGCVRDRLQQVGIGGDLHDGVEIGSRRGRGRQRQG